MAKRKKDPIRDWANSDPATKWANDRIVTKLMRLATERHLLDKERTDIIWRKDKAADALEWTPRATYNLARVRGVGSGQREPSGGVMVMRSG